MAELAKLKAVLKGNVEQEFQEQRLKWVLGLALAGGNRLAEATAVSREGLSTARRLAGLDADNASFQFWYARQEKAMAQLETRAGNRAQGKEHLLRALVIQRVQVKRYPMNPLFAFELSDTCFDLSNRARMVGDEKEIKDFALEAEAALRGASERNREEPLLKAMHGNVKAGAGGALLRAGDRRGAAQQFREAERILRSAGSTASNDRVRIYRILVFGRLAGYKEVIGRTEEALALRRDAVADGEALVKSNPGSKFYSGRLAVQAFALSQLYNRRQEYREGLQVALQTYPTLDAEYRRSPTVQTGLALWQSLFNLRYLYAWSGDYENGISAAKRSVAIVEELLRKDPTSSTLLWNRSNSYINLSGNYEWAGRRAEALAATAHNVELLAGIDMRKWVVGDKGLAADVNRSAARMHSTLLEPEEGIELAVKGRKVAEEMLQSDAASRSTREQLAGAYEDEVQARLDAGDTPGALVARKSEMAIRRKISPINLRQRVNAGMREVTSASIALRAGDRKLAGEWLELAKTALDDAEQEIAKELAEVPDDLAAVDILGGVCWWRSMAAEMRGDAVSALQQLERARGLLERLVREQPKTKLHRADLAEVTRLIARMGMAPGAVADLAAGRFTRDAKKDEASYETVKMWSDFAAGLRLAMMDPAHIAVVHRHGVAVGRRLVETEATPRNRAVLAEQLLGLATELTRARERGAKLREALEAGRESVRIFSELAAAKKVPEEFARGLGRAKIVVSAVEERLQREESAIRRK